MKGDAGVPLWLSGLGIQCCHCSGSGYCSSIGLIPGPRNLHMLWVWPKKKKKVTAGTPRILRYEHLYAVNQTSQMKLANSLKKYHLSSICR